MKSNNPMKSNTISRSWLWIVCTIVLLIALDLLTKYLLYNQAIGSQFALLEPAMNYGISFSIQVPYMIVIPLSIIAVVAFLYLYRYKSFPLWAMILLVAGTMGNLYDRIVYSGVRDFLVFPDWFIFNLADVFLFVGILIVFVVSL